MVNLHIYPTSMLKEARIMRITKVLSAARLFSSIELVGVQEEQLPSVEAVDERRSIVRMARRSRIGGNSTIGKGLRTIEWSARVAHKYAKLKGACISCHSLPVLPLCVLLKYLTRGKLVYETHELETETIECRGLRRLLYKLLEKSLIRFADQVVVVSESIAEWYRDHYRIPRPIVVRNIPEFSGDFVTPKINLIRRHLGIPEGELIFLYQGRLGPGRSIEKLLRIFSDMDAKRHLVFLGFGLLKDQIIATAKISENIHYLPAVAPGELLPWTSGADVGIVGLENGCLCHSYALPNKLFEYMSAGVPALANDLPEMRRVVEEGAWGWVAQSDETTWKALIASLTPAQIALKREAIKKVVARYSWAEEAKKVAQAYQRVFAEDCVGANCPKDATIPFESTR